MALEGINVIELGGLAPGPFCGLILSDFGANVVRVDKPNNPMIKMDRLARGKKSIIIDLKNKEGINVIKRLCRNADVLIEPFRPGVMEKLGLGPDELMKENPKLIYARLTGFGQKGPYKDMAGHDINYLALSGVLSILGRKNDNPFPPINLLADFAGGGLMCSLGICLALFERTKSGKGQVIDCNMVGGSAYVSTWIWRTTNLIFWGKPRGQNVLDSGGFFYETYKTKDEKYMAVGALESQFFTEFRKVLGLSSEELNQRDDPVSSKTKLASIFARKTQAEWCDLFSGTSACVSPVIDRSEAHDNEHNKANDNFIEGAYGPEPAPAPKLERTPAAPKMEEPVTGGNTSEILQEHGFTEEEITNLIQCEAVIEKKKQLNK